MLNKKPLSLKLNKSLACDIDAPFTPVDQTLRTPIDPPKDLYFPNTPSVHNNNQSSLYSHPQQNESDDILTDVDEPMSLKLRTYTLCFTPAFDNLVLHVYSQIILFPTTTPFLGTIPPLGLVSRVANEAFHQLIKFTSENASSGNAPPLYDTQNILNIDALKNHALQPVILQLIRKRLIDLCLCHRASIGAPHLTTPTTVQFPVGLNGAALGFAQASANPSAPSSAASGNSIYSGLGMKQLSLVNLLLNETNIANHQNANQTAQAIALSRLRSSSLNLRKHSLTRNNSYNGSNWLHVGNVLSVRPNTSLGLHQELNASTDSLQLMHDFVPQAFIQRLANSQGNILQGQGSGLTPGGFNSMMLDYQTPPTSSKSSFSLTSTPNNSFTGNYPYSMTPGSVGSISEMEDFSAEPMQSRGSSRGNSLGSLLPKPLTINTDTGSFLHNMNPHGQAGYVGYGGQQQMMPDEMLNSPFLSAVTPSDEGGYFLAQGSTPGASSGSSEGHLHFGNGARGQGVIAEETKKDASVAANNNNKINLPNQFSLSEKKRDSLKLKRGIH